MTTVYLSPLTTILQYFNNAGSSALSGGTITIYAAGTSTPQTTYTDSTGDTENANPITLNSSGRLNNVAIWQSAGVAIKAVIADASGNQIAILDVIAGIDDPAVMIATLASAVSGEGADLVANSVRSFDLFSSVRLWTPATMSAGRTVIAILEGGAGINDGLGGMFYYDSSSSLADDSINVIKPNVIANGRFIRIYPGVSGQAFTGTLTGMSATTTGAIIYSVNSRSVATLQCGAITGTSNANAMTMTGLPAEVTPPTLGVSVPCLLENNGNGLLMGWATVNTAGVITFGLGSNPNTSGFTASGTKGLPAGWTITYPLT